MMILEKVEQVFKVQLNLITNEEEKIRVKKYEREKKLIKISTNNARTQVFFIKIASLVSIVISLSQM